ncbi:MAG: hypothetical protein OEY34_02780 [Cyclobacteriaceae bacterium]|nr:hypothetical protein [Cyclobacteriaceae bacterium]
MRPIKVIYYSIFILLFITPASLWGQDLHDRDFSDTTHIEQKSFSKEKVESLKSKRDFTYDVENRKSEGFVDSIKNFLSYILYLIFRNIDLSPDSPWTIAVYILGAGLIVYLIIWFNKSDSMWVFSRNRGNIQEYEIENEDIHSINYEKEIETALSNKQFRAAIRLLYLRSLRDLSEAHKIEWSDGKTNYDYYLEIENSAMRNAFADLSLQFNYVWYGNYTPSMEIFRHAEEKYQTLKKQLE